jgi:two-component sensor histidine kinase
MAPHTSSPEAIALDLPLAVVAASNAPLLLLDGNLIVVSASISFCKTFQIECTQIAGHALASLGAGEWNAPKLVSLLNATASGFAEVQDYEFDLVREGRGTRSLLLNASRLAYAGNGPVRMILAVTDVTEVRASEQNKSDLIREKGVLLQELHHRVANSLQIIASVLMQSARKVQSEETRSHLYDAHQRVMSVAALQRHLAASSSSDVDMRPYLTTLCGSIAASMIHDRGSISLLVNADENTVPADTSVSLGLIVTELVINALKHAFPENRKGAILVTYSVSGESWRLTVSDDGVGVPHYPPAKGGLGTSIVEALARQLGAKISVTGASPGTMVSVRHDYVPVLMARDPV